MYRILIEGITGSGKTTLYHKLLGQIFSEGYSNILHASQFYTSSLVWKKTENTQRQIVDIMSRFIDMMLWFDEQYEAYHPNDPYRLYQSVLETFHLENFSKGYIYDRDIFKELDSKLHTLKYKIVYLYLEEKDIQDRCVSSTRHYRNSDKWNNYLSSLGKDDYEISQYFCKIQNNLEECLQNTSLEILRINTRKQDWDLYIRKIMEFCNQ